MSGPRVVTKRKMPRERRSLNHKFTVGGCEGILVVGLYEDDTVGEIYLYIAKEGSTLGGIFNCFAIAVSGELQYGVPLARLCEKFVGVSFAPDGITNNPEIATATSIVDYVFRFLRLKFLK